HNPHGRKSESTVKYTLESPILSYCARQHTRLFAPLEIVLGAYN
ncbi:uncharacterized protein PgNI_03954, partial [Pyricularia grisea]|uniref:Uncharacterized protein n=1 Tax=Pyricularia grisea TaxID=148305 RepID=A0A6P8BFD0_PYRGI